MTTALKKAGPTESAAGVEIRKRVITARECQERIAFRCGMALLWLFLMFIGSQHHHIRWFFVSLPIKIFLLISLPDILYLLRIRRDGPIEVEVRVLPRDSEKEMFERRCQKLAVFALLWTICVPILGYFLEFPRSLAWLFLLNLILPLISVTTYSVVGQLRLAWRARIREKVLAAKASSATCSQQAAQPQTVKAPRHWLTESGLREDVQTQSFKRDR